MIEQGNLYTRVRGWYCMCSCQPAMGLVVYQLQKKYFPIYQQPILLLVDSCTSGIETFPLCRDFLGWRKDCSIFTSTLAQITTWESGIFQVHKIISRWRINNFAVALLHWLGWVDFLTLKSWAQSHFYTKKAFQKLG